jgi:subtilase family serine protease
MNAFCQHKREFKLKRIDKKRQEPVQQLEPRRLLSMTPALDLIPDASASTVLGFSPSQITTAYGLSGLTFSGGKVAANGAGQTVAVVDAYNDPTISSDLKTFDSHFGLPTAKLKVVNQTGGSSLPASDGGWAQEMSLDVEWIHAIAPGANILLVETNSSNTSDLMAGVNYARSASGVSVVSMSWGGSEFNGETSYDSEFTTPSGHTGITFVAASGDSGSASGVDWPASSPDVLSVGGTSLSVSSASGTYSSETGWSDSTGGVSQYEGEPEYQSGVQSLDARTVPDVAANANPSTGVAVYDSDSYEGESGWLEFGGTSAAAPQWAGLIAIADQGRTLNKLGTLDGATNTLPTLYSLEGSSSTYSVDFHDITSGATSFDIQARAGYDLVSGIGSAKANHLIPAMVSSKISTALTLTTASRYVPPLPPGYGRYFVATAAGSFAGQVLSNAPTPFTTMVNNVSPLEIKQALFDSSQPPASPATIDAGQNTFIGETSPSTSSVTGSASTSKELAPPSEQSPLATLGSTATAVTSAAHNLEEDLLSVSLCAQEFIGQLGRDIAIDLAHEEIATADSMLATFTSERTATAAGIVATVIAITCLEGENGRDKKKTPSIFSGRMIAMEF